MKVSVYYLNGMVNEFNTENFTAPEPFGKGKNITSELDLRLDLLQDQGLILEVYWYTQEVDRYTASITDEGSGREIYYAGREPGRFIRLVAKSELSEIAKVCVDGECVLFKQGDEIINVIKFNNQETMCYSDEVTASMNDKALQLYEYIHNAYPSMSDEEICQKFGYTAAAFERIKMEREAQRQAVDDEDNEGTEEMASEESGLAVLENQLADTV